MARYAFKLPTVDATRTVRLDTDPGSDSPADGMISPAGAAISATLTADHIGFLPEVLGPDGVATLYLKVLTYGGAVTGSPVTLAGYSEATPTPAAPGGSSAVVRKFPFTFSTAGLVTGHTVYTPTAGDVLLDAWFQIDLAWDGTDAQADFGTFTSGGDPDPQGMFAQTFRGPVNIGGGLNGNPNRGTRDKAFQDDALLLGQSLSSLRDVGMFDQIINVLKAPPVAETPQDAAEFVLYDGNSPYSPVLPDTHGDRILPAVFTGTPIKVCVSQDGTNTGADPGATQGAGALYLVTATPV